MDLKDYDFSGKKTIKKKCLEYAGNSNKVVCRRRDCYLLDRLFGIPELDGFYLSIHNDTGMYIAWSECGDHLVRFFRVFEDYSIEKLCEHLRERVKYKGLEGLKLLLSEMERAGAFIESSMITALAYSGENELAAHYASYREDFIAKQEEKKQKELLERQRKEAEEERQRQKEEEARMIQAEKSLRNHEWVENRECGEDRLILRLFAKHNISLPGRTKGCMRKKLRNVQFSKNNTVNVIWREPKGNSTCPESVFQYLTLLFEQISA